jgi:hypothetical protein
MKDEDKTKEQLVNELVNLRESLGKSSVDLRACKQDLDDVARYVVSEFKSPLGMIVGFAELLEEEHTTLSEGELRHCILKIKESGRKVSEMVNALLLLANSRRLSDNVWYAAYLAAMGETALPQWVSEAGESISEAYRFTCLPASSAPLIIRFWKVEGEPPGFRAIAKLGSGQADREGEDGSAPREVQWTLTAEEWDNLLAAVNGSKFWFDGSSLEQLGWLKMVGVGGEEWIFEGWRDDRHKVRTVWNPDEEKTHAAYALGRSFVKSLPDWFALEMAQLWTTDSRLEISPRFGDRIDLDFLL